MNKIWQRLTITPLLFSLIIMILLSTISAFAVEHQSININGTNLEIIRVDMKKPGNKVTVVLSGSFPHKGESFEEMIKRSHPVAAINGTFFSKKTLKPVGDIVIDGVLKNEGRFGTAMAITPDNRVSFMKVPVGYNVDWSGYETVIACGPRLIKAGNIVVNPEGEGFKDSHVLGDAIRSAAGITANRTLLLVSTKETVSLKGMAKIMASLGCTDAINLDGGASTAISYHERVLIPAGRPLTNIIVVYENIKKRKTYGKVIIKNDKDASGSIKNGHIQFQNAMKLYENGKLKEAEAAMEKACKLNPTSANYIKLAQIRMKMGLNKKAADAYAESAGIYLKKGLLNEASGNARKALDLDPKNRKASEYYSIAQKKRGKAGP